MKDVDKRPPESLCDKVERCKAWLRKEWDITLKHIYREQNSVADKLAKVAGLGVCNIMVMASLSRYLMQEINEDKLRVARSRRVQLRRC